MSKHAGAALASKSALARREVRRPEVGAATLARIRIIAEALFTTSDGPPPLDRLDWLVAEMDDFLGRAGSQARWTFALLTWLVTVSAPFFMGRFRTLPHLDRGERVAALAALERHLGEPLFALKAVLCLVYYEHPDAAREVGFDGRCALPASPAQENPAS